jgi:hypothetical protein
MGQLPVAHAQNLLQDRVTSGHLTDVTFGQVASGHLTSGHLTSGSTTSQHHLKCDFVRWLRFRK